MDISSGARLGPYEIVARLGAGGMGEVWRARDTRLDRTVAIKVLPSNLAKDEQLKMRFEREAKAISQLNHPNICTLHDVGDGYLVMEMLEGETLAARIARGPMPPADVFRYGAQIADALHRAHRAGIVHRDLKPANVMLTKSGAKLLDFGLAKPSGYAAASSDAPTIVGEALTEKGVILGTMQYMAPEQLEGADTDARTDLFALGAVLYEMATGKRAFEGSTRTSVIAAIVSAQPAPISSIVPLIPPALEHVVQKCLEKDPDDRWQSAHDVSEQLRWLATTSGALAASVPQPPSRARAKRIAIAAAVLVALLAGIAIERLVLRKPPLVPIVRYASFSGLDWQPAASPDGKSIAFCSTRDGKPRVWIKQLNGGGEVAITEGPDWFPRFSPDGSSLLFARVDPQSAVYRVAAVGGEARKLIEDAYDAEWSPDGQKIAFVRAATENGAATQMLMLGDANGGNAKRLYSTVRWFLWSPRFSPDGKTLAISCTGGNSTASGSIALIDLASGKTREIAVAGSPTSLVWLDDDRFLYGHAHTVTGVQTAAGEIVRRDVASGKEEILHSLPTLGLHITRAGDDRLVVETPAKRSNLRVIPLDRPSEIAWLTRGGSVTDRQPAFSPDGEWVVFSSDRSSNLDLWAISRKSGALKRLTDDPGQDWDPAFTPDGKHIVWSSNRSGHFEIWKANADGTAPRQISSDGADAENPTQAPNGDVFHTSGNAKKLGLWRIRPDGSAAQLVRGTALHPEVSPDGVYVAYHVPGAEEVLHVLRVSDGQTTKFAAGFGTSAVIPLGRSRWMPDGKAIAFIGQQGDRIGVFVQPFAFGRDTNAQRKALVGFDADMPTESFGIDPKGGTIVTSLLEDLNTLTLVDKISLR